MTKQSLIVVLVGVNLALLAALILSVHQPPAAQAQAVARANEYILVAAQAEAGTDVLYLFDLPNHQIHGFRPQRGQPLTIANVSSRNLQRDFRRR